MIGIKRAARMTCVKPSGTSSLVLGTSSGVHGWHDEYYIRNIRVGKSEAIYGYLKERMPEIVADDLFKKDIQAVVSLPQKAPQNAILRHESSIDTLERVRHFTQNWIRKGHRHGINSHNVSCTINVKEDEWGVTGEWMYANRYEYNGIAVMPYDGGTYVQAPFESCDKERYESFLPHLKSIDLKQVKEREDNTDLSGESACSGGSCEVSF
jgi:ribonucleoside-diphosphate reductase alpha chain